MKTTLADLTRQLETKLKPLYGTLIQNVQHLKGAKSFFSVQWGKNFPIEEQKGILFVGRATNGWVTDSEELEELFGNDEKTAIFNRKDQMQWAEERKGYNTQKSAFWRVIRQVAVSCYPDNWSSFIAWSNLYKVSPYQGGNPDNSLKAAQEKVCCEILKKEIEILSPEFVIFLTGKSWAENFILYLNEHQPTKSIAREEWDKYVCKLYQINNTYYILSEHPERKKEEEHVKSILSLLKQTHQQK